MTEHSEHCGDEECVWCKSFELAQDFVDHAIISVAHNGGPETSLALLFAFVTTHTSVMPNGSSNKLIEETAHKALAHALTRLPKDVRK